MIIYILKDAYEKAEEIDVRAEEEFKILLTTYTREDNSRVEEGYSKKKRKLLLDMEM